MGETWWNIVKHSEPCCILSNRTIRFRSPFFPKIEERAWRKLTQTDHPTEAALRLSNYTKHLCESEPTWINPPTLESYLPVKYPRPQIAVLVFSIAGVQADSPVGLKVVKEVIHNSVVAASQESSGSDTDKRVLSGGIGASRWRWGPSEATTLHDSLVGGYRRLL